jgi:uncharacterized protein YndB with AHSA1/START domain
MTPATLEIKAAIQISKAIHDVFEAIVDPAHLSNYFIADSTGRIEEGKELTWHFPEFSTDVPVTGKKIEKDRSISFEWDGSENKKTLVEITLKEQDNGSTLVTVTEKSMENNEAGIKWLSGNSGGWANFLACMKAYLEHGINLRKGAFDFMREHKPA